MNWTVFSKPKRFWKFAIRIALFLVGMLIVIFNDAFGSSEAFGIFAFAYFLLPFFLLCRWIFKQIKSIVKLRSEKTKAELMHLQSQVNPHFFFNTLNILYGLVVEKSDQAPEVVLKLSDMMRYTIYEGREDLEPLTQEITYLEN